MTSNHTYSRYRTLEEIRERKQELRREMDRSNEHIGQLWGHLFVKRDKATRGQFVANVISHSALAIDAFLMVRKLRKNYKGVVQLFKRNKRK